MIIYFIKDYKSALEDADEKVQLANQIYDLVSDSLHIYILNTKNDCNRGTIIDKLKHCIIT